MSRNIRPGPFPAEDRTRSRPKLYHFRTKQLRHHETAEPDENSTVL